MQQRHQEVEKGYLKTYFPKAPFLQPICITKTKDAFLPHFLHEPMQGRPTLRYLLCRFYKAGGVPQQAYWQQQGF